MSDDPAKDFENGKRRRIDVMSHDSELAELGKQWFLRGYEHQYSYNFTWMGRPIIQYPQDIVAVQEIIWNTRPDVIVETGIAHGGSLILYASLLKLLGTGGRVIGVDIDIRAHNRREIERHSMFEHISLIEGPSTDEAIVQQVRDQIGDGQRVMVVLDSNHTHQHVLEELELYSPMVTRDCYLVVFDTVVEDLPNEVFPNRPWGQGNNPKTAVWEFLKSNPRFVIDKEVEDKLLITVAPDGFLRCVTD